MRSKVKVPDERVYRMVARVFRLNRVNVIVASEKRFMFSVENLPEEIAQAIQAIGATVKIDSQYDLESQSKEDL